MSSINITGGTPKDVEGFFNRLNLESALQDIRSSEKNKPEDRKHKVQKQQEHNSMESGLGKDGGGCGTVAPTGGCSAAPAAISIA